MTPGQDKGSARINVSDLGCRTVMAQRRGSQRLQVLSPEPGVNCSEDEPQFDVKSQPVTIAFRLMNNAIQATGGMEVVKAQVGLLIEAGLLIVSSVFLLPGPNGGRMFE